MLRHPFRGIVVPAEDNQEPNPANDSTPVNPPSTQRRGFLLQVMAAGAAAGALLASRSAEAQTGTRRYTTMAVGEEGGNGVRPVQPPRSTSPPRYTTFAVGEEGGTPPPAPPRSPPRYTTFAIGEEGGSGTTITPSNSFGGAPRLTTFPLAEEG